jgi:hypothetical protein
MASPGVEKLGGGAAPPVLIHIGFHKTGSTWLQQELFPKVRNARLVPRPVIRRELLLPYPFRFDPQAARRGVLGDAGGRVVLSEEELSGNLHTGGLHGGMSKEIAERLLRAFPEAHVVIFVRSQKGMIASAYKQYVESGGSGSIHRFLRPSRAPHKTPNFTLDFLAYDGLVGHYESLFGREAVHVYPWEALSAERAAFVARFAAGLGLDVDVQALSFAARNVGFRRRTRRVMRVLNHFHDREIPNSTCVVGIPGAYPVLKRLGQWLNRLPGMGRAETLEDLLDAARIAEIEDRFRESNARLEASRGLGLARWGYPLPQRPG